MEVLHAVKKVPAEGIVKQDVRVAVRMDAKGVMELVQEPVINLALVLVVQIGVKEAVILFVLLVKAVVETVKEDAKEAVTYIVVLLAQEVPVQEDAMEAVILNALLGAQDALEAVVEYVVATV